MKHALLLIVLGCLLLSLAPCQQQDMVRTHGKLNGRLWKGWTREGRVAYVCGLIEGSQATARALEMRRFVANDVECSIKVNSDFNSSDFLIPAFNAGEISEEVDRFYRETANVIWPVVAAFEYVGRSLKGTDPQILKT